MVDLLMQDIIDQVAKMSANVGDWEWSGMNEPTRQTHRELAVQAIRESLIRWEQQ